MKINFYALIFILLPLLPVQLFGQVVADRVETSCDNQTRSIYEELGSNKIIMIVAAATNCSICMSEAPEIASFSDNHSANVSVWGAMNRLSGDADCPAVDDWESDYNWQGIFTFLDLDDFWHSGGFTSFTVINPFDSSIAYQGLSFQVAKDTTEALSQMVGIDETASVLEVQDAYPNPFKNDITIQLNSNSSKLIRVRLFDIIGKEILNKEYEVKPYLNELRLDLVDYNIQQGVHLLRIESGDQVKTIRLIRD